MFAFTKAISLLIIAAAFAQNEAANVTTEATSSEAATSSGRSGLPKLPLAIHYEALCPDSVFFIRQRLYPALRQGDWWERTDLKLYPFGKAGFYNNTKLGELQVFCQHDNAECELNALHACILEHLELKEAFGLINCMLRSYDNVMDQCAKHFSLDVSQVKECKRSRKTAEILLPYGEVTLDLELSFVPSIVFNNNFEPYDQRSIRTNFQAHFCRQYQQKFEIKLPQCG